MFFNLTIIAEHASFYNKLIFL